VNYINVRNGINCAIAAAIIAVAWFIGGLDKYAFFLPHGNIAGAVCKSFILLATVCAMAVLMYPWQNYLNSKFGGASAPDGFMGLPKLLWQNLRNTDGTFSAAPAAVFCAAVCGFGFVPFEANGALFKTESGIVYLLCCAVLANAAFAAAELARGTKNSVQDGMNRLYLSILLGIPLFLAALSFAMFGNSLSAESFIAAQQTARLGGFVPGWFIFEPVAGQAAFLVFCAGTLAFLNFGPFKSKGNPDAEFSGAQKALVTLSFYIRLVLFSALIALFFLGAGNAPWEKLSFIPQWFWLGVKIFAAAALLVWADNHFSAMERTRVFSFTVKTLLPLAALSLLAEGALLCLR